MKNNIHARVAARLLIALGLLTGSPAPSRAQTGPQDLAWATLEDLLNIQITSASRKEQRADEAPAAVSVLTQDDIRRSGIHTLPELFRLVPGVQVAEINSSSWAVSIRGFNDQFSNKLLVLIDGRSIYKRNTSGVFWDAEDLVLDDIDRIEIVRGPGGAVWGANAVNGVINIVTKAAKDTQGALVRVGVGTFDRGQVNARYGGSFGNASYRVYSQWTDRSETTLANRTPAHDNWNVLTNGLRVDWSRGADEWTVDGSVRSGDAHPLWKSLQGPTPGVAPTTDTHSVFHNGSVLGRWTHRGGNGSSLQVQSVGAISYRSDLVTEKENTFDVDLQYRRKLGARNDVVSGGGYRVVDNTTSTSFSFSLTPATSNTSVVNVFAQDEIALGDRLRVTIGSKLEHDTFAGWGLQPTARVMWDPARRQHLWASVSRALRTPSNKELSIRLNVAVVPGERSPIVIGFLGNPDYKNEELLDTEAGYRLELGSTVSLDVAAFRGHYKGLTTNEPLAPVFETTPGPPHLFIAKRYENRLQADTSGVEIAAHVTPVSAWRVDASYSGFRLTPHLDAASHDTAAASFDGSAPAHQWQLHSSVRLGPRTEANAALFHTAALRNLAIPAYTRADARVEVKLTRHLSAIAAGRNLLSPVHVEYFTPVMVSTLVPRSADFQLLWRF
jgi:iron complex outermembrane recepter protein